MTLSFFIFLISPLIHFLVFLTFSQIHSCVIMHIWLTFIFIFLFKVGYDVHGIIIVFMILFTDDLLLPVKVYNWRRNVYLYIGQICFFGKMWKLSYRLFFIWEICSTSQNIWKEYFYIQVRKKYHIWNMKGYLVWNQKNKFWWYLFSEEIKNTEE